jgi:hypothetical protein
MAAAAVGPPSGANAPVEPSRRSGMPAQLPLKPVLGILQTLAMTAESVKPGCTELREPPQPVINVESFTVKP